MWGRHLTAPTGSEERRIILDSLSVSRLRHVVYRTGLPERVVLRAAIAGGLLELAHMYAVMSQITDEAFWSQTMNAVPPSRASFPHPPISR